MIFGINDAIFWLLIACILFIVEIIGGTVALLCLGGGALISAIGAWIGVESITLQVIICAVVTIILFVAAGPAIRRFYAGHRGGQKYQSNMEALIGRQGKVTNVVTDNFADGGRVQIDGDNWQAYTSKEDSPLTPGTVVRVDAYDSIVIKVSKV